MLTDVPASLDDLGALNVFGLASLLLVREQRLPVAPTRRLTTQLMRRLCDAGVIVTPWPEAQWMAEPRAETTPLERLHWRYVWQAYTLDELLGPLVSHLADLCSTAAGKELCALIWSQLAAAEAESFFAGQLRKHGFDDEWAPDMEYAIRNAPIALSIAQWRYCAWAAVRHGASLSQQRCGQLATDVLRDNIYRELLKRASHAASPMSRGCSLPPFSPLPHSAAGQLFAQYMIRLGEAFWTKPPTVSTISKVGG